MVPIILGAAALAASAMQAYSSYKNTQSSASGNVAQKSGAAILPTHTTESESLAEKIARIKSEEQMQNQQMLQANQVQASQMTQPQTQIAMAQQMQPQQTFTPTPIQSPTSLQSQQNLSSTANAIASRNKDEEKYRNMFSK
jgi:7-keto-8-aminopelargonate synthetase-like enzyme